MEQLINNYFINEKGQIYNPNNIQRSILRITSDLGISRKITYNKAGSTFIKNSQEIEQGKIEGELRFFRDVESEYKKFVSFIRTAQKLTFVDIRIDNGVTEEYYVDIDYSKIGRVKEKGGILLSEVEFYCTTNWYKQKNIVYTIEENANVFGFPIDFENMRFGNGSSNKLNIENEGFEEAPIFIQLNGALVNPKIQLIKDKQVINSLQLQVEIQEFERIEYSTKDDDLYIQKINQDGTRSNLFDLLDINNSNFFKIPVRIN